MNSLYNNLCTLNDFNRTNNRQIRLSCSNHVSREISAVFEVVAFKFKVRHGVLN